jgi:hypothetical protein
MSQVTETEVFRACRTLFGPELQLSRDFLSYLKPAGVRSAYRKKAKMTHPDRFAVSSHATRSRQQRLFQDLNQAHQTVQSYLKQKNHFPSGHFATNRATRPAYSQTKYQWHDSQKQQQRGPLPARPLQFGLFLYYLGIIPFTAVISAIIWQRKQRPVLGEIARHWGWLKESDITRIINHRSGVHKFGERAEQLGLLNPLQVRTLLFHQRSRQQQMGHYFVSQGYFSEATLHQLLHKLAENNRTFRRGLGDHYYFHHR